MPINSWVERAPKLVRAVAPAEPANIKYLYKKQNNIYVIIYIMAGEKWFEFVARMKKQIGAASLGEAMTHASKNKHLWKKGGDATSVPVGTKVKNGGKKGNTKKNKTGSRRKM